MGFRIRLSSFSGIAPRFGKRLLAENQAQAAVNCVLTSGEIHAFLQLNRVTASLVSGDILSVFRLTSGGNDYWLSWTRDVDVARAGIAGDTTQRICFTGDGEPRITNFSTATNGSAPYPVASGFYVLGVSKPTAAPTVTPSGGVSGTTVDRVYRYTFVTPWGEEGAPSPPHAPVNGKIDDTWALTVIQGAPLNTITVTGASWAGGVATLTVASGETRGLRIGEEVNVTGITPSDYNGSKLVLTDVTATTIKYAVVSDPGAYSAGGSIARVAPHNFTSGKTRIYRTLTASGVTTYRFVAEINIGTTTYNDTVLDTALGEELKSELWDQPPTNMKGIISLPNNVLAGFSGNELCLSEPAQPHAWNPEYRRTADTDIVGLGFFSNTIVAGTLGNPYRAIGTDPASMEWIRDNNPWPCLAKRSFANLPYGTLYASKYGYVFCGDQGFVISTIPFYTERDWKAVNASTIVAAVYAGRLYFRHQVEGTIGQMQILDKNEPAALTTAAIYPVELWTDELSGTLYAIIDNKLYEWDANTGERMVFDWWSKEFVLPKPTSIGWGKIDAEFTMTEAEIEAAQAAFDAAVAANAALIAALATYGSPNAAAMHKWEVNGSALSELPPLNWESLSFTLWGKAVNGTMEVRAQRTLTSDRPFRLPQGKWEAFSAEVGGNIPVRGIVLAETHEDLKQA